MHASLKYLLLMVFITSSPLNAGFKELHAFYGVRSGEPLEAQLAGMIQVVALGSHSTRQGHFQTILSALPMFQEGHTNTQNEQNALAALGELVDYGPWECPKGTPIADFLQQAPVCRSLLDFLEQHLPDVRNAVEAEDPPAPLERVHSRHKDYARPGRIRLALFHRILGLFYKWAQSQLGSLDTMPGHPLDKKDPPEDDPDDSCGGTSNPIEASA